jgi:hypothetical protein
MPRAFAADKTICGTPHEKADAKTANGDMIGASGARMKYPGGVDVIIPVRRGGQLWIAKSLGKGCSTGWTLK